MNKILLIDGNSIFYRAYYGSAFSGKILTSSKGIPVNGINTFFSMILKQMKGKNYTHVFVAFDAGKKTKRHEKLETYKSGRSKMPEELKIQFPIIKKMLDALKISRKEIDLIEADDIIATLSKFFSINDNQIHIFSSDKDLYQLVDERISIIAPKNGSLPNVIISEKNFIEVMEISQEKIIDFKGISGDSSDSLPGIKGVGEKGAIKLLNKYHNLENIYKNIDDLTPSLKQKFIDSKEIAFLCKELATLDINVKLDLTLNDLKLPKNISEEFYSFLEELELKKLKIRFKKLELIFKENKPFSNLIY
ncbi:MAG: hypothetical protein K4H23_03955 [Mollicutes bacterium PWAP]|nr:hypothetical protein [Mollicutes bacterium PWAP]